MNPPRGGLEYRVEKIGGGGGVYSKSCHVEVEVPFIVVIQCIH